MEYEDILKKWQLKKIETVDDLDNEAHRVYNFRRQKMILKVIVLYFLGRESALK